MIYILFITIKSFSMHTTAFKLEALINDYLLQLKYVSEEKFAQNLRLPNGVRKRLSAI
ncbi:MAG TPA: hypothetical protein VFW07_15950 [Parafilimonas sp.]|nr:hypothetical protein [Parafilimonas sp.]